MRIERDTAHILSGVRHGKTIGSPIADAALAAAERAAPAADPVPGEVRRQLYKQFGENALYDGGLQVRAERLRLRRKLVLTDRGDQQRVDLQLG